MSNLHDPALFVGQWCGRILESGLKQPSIGGAHILHVEDEILIAMEVESICRENGAASVTHISELSEAESADIATFDVAMIDLMLRGGSTIALARRLDAAGVPLIFVSGHDRSTIGAEFPGAQFLDKPFSAGGLSAAIAKALQGRPSRRI